MSKIGVRTLPDPYSQLGLTDHNSIPAIMLGQDPCSGNRYISEYFFSNPARSGKGSIVGVRPLGKRVHAGSFHLEDGGLRFTLRTVNTVHARAIDFAGNFQPRRAVLELEKAPLLQGLAAGQRQRRMPKPL